MKRHEVPLQENGRMILPAELRRVLGVGKGDRVLIQAEGPRIELTTPKRARGTLARERVRRRFPDASGVVDEFLAERRAAPRRGGARRRCGRGRRGRVSACVIDASAVLAYLFGERGARTRRASGWTGAPRSRRPTCRR